MNILFIAPLPPPINGQSFVSDVLFKGLSKDHNVTVINFAKEKNVGNIVLIKRFLKILNILYLIWRNRNKKDAIYLTISQSLLGNLKDLLTYLCLSSHLSKITVHLHGGAIKTELWDKHTFIFRLNKFFLRKIGSVIISGESHRAIFSGIVDDQKIHVTPNFAVDDMFIPKEDWLSKFNKIAPLKILYVSGMRNKKGYLDLFQAFLKLSEKHKSQIQIDFAGAFETEGEKDDFLKAIEAYNQIAYHGIVTETEKKRLFFNAHVFCLPTKYLEGQPMSILEAYAAGCFVLTTNMGGISDIFIDDVNGYEVLPDAPISISEKIQACLDNLEQVKKVSEQNIALAIHKFQKDVFVTSILNIIANRIKN